MSSVPSKQELKDEKKKKRYRNLNSTIFERREEYLTPVFLSGLSFENCIRDCPEAVIDSEGVYHCWLYDGRLEKDTAPFDFCKVKKGTIRPLTHFETESLRHERPYNRKKKKDDWKMQILFGE